MNHPQHLSSPIRNNFVTSTYPVEQQTSLKTLQFIALHKISLRKNKLQKDQMINKC